MIERITQVVACSLSEEEAVTTLFPLGAYQSSIKLNAQAICMILKNCVECLSEKFGDMHGF